MTVTAAPPLVLVVDDDRVSLRLLQVLLAHDAYRIASANDGDEALRQARALRPDLMLVDVHKSGLDAYDLCRRVRRDSELAETPILIVTAVNDRDARIHGIRCGADDFISKPCDELELLARIRTMTRLNRFRRLRDGHRLAEQIEMAATIQRQLLPQRMPAIEGLEIASRYWPASVVGGDYYDLVQRGDDLYFVVADVAGHGLASALFISNARSALRSLLTVTGSPRALALGLNQRMAEDAGDTGMFVSAVIGRYCSRSSVVTIVNCGHPAPVFVRRSGGLDPVAASAPPLGICPSIDPIEYDSPLDVGDLVCLHTDGLIESVNCHGDVFGPERLHSVLAANPHVALASVAERALRAAAAFHGSAATDDDLTLLLMRREH